MVNVFKLLIEKGLIVKENKTYYYKSKNTSDSTSVSEDQEDEDDFDDID